MSKRLFDDTDEATEGKLIELTRAMSDEKKLKVLVISLLSSLVFLFTPIS